MLSSNRFLGAAALALALAVPTAVFAQQAPAAPAAGPVPLTSPVPGARHHGGGAYMRALRALDLSAAQKQQITSAVQQTRQANQNADPATRKANRTKLQAQIDAILTPTQRTQLQTTLQQQRQQREAQSPAGGAPVPAPSTTP
jgi:Spy/CpxP family protein refolding chaperone